MLGLQNMLLIIVFMTSIGREGQILADNSPSLRELHMSLSNLMEEVKEIKDNLAICEAKVIDPTQTPKVAFYAQRSTTMGQVSTWTTVMFDQVSLNQGEGFNTVSSHFQANVKGVYQFSFVSVSNSDNHSSCRIVKNGNVTMTSLGSRGHGQAVALATILLDVEDEVWVELRPQGITFVIYENENYRYSAFSGNLLFEL